MKPGVMGTLVEWQLKKKKHKKKDAFGLLTLALTSPHPNNECVEDKSSGCN